ncbi:MAG TPA: FG-GAP-like repeat-containing protein [Gemmatimonadales bacterium]|nr:FG-GAP-like repeat-containing protein [Gemmatimonadales bacterium]
MKTLVSLAALVVLLAGCPEKPIDTGALITARTVGLEQLQRGLLTDAEQEFKKVIELAPRDPLGYANLGLTYLRGGRYADAESPLKRARRLDPTNPEIALITAKLYSLTGRSAEALQMLATLPPDARVLYALAELERQSGDSCTERRYAERLRQVLERSPANLAVRLKLADVFLRLGESDSTIRYLEDARRLRPEPPREAKPYLAAALDALHAGRASDGRAALDRFLRLIEVTAPYQESLAQVDWIEGPLAGRPVLSFNPQSLITMRGISAGPETGQVHFTDVTGESGLPDLGAPPTALAWGNYDQEGGDNLFVAAVTKDRRALVSLYGVQGGFFADVSSRMPLPLPAGAVTATFADYDNDGWLDLFAIGTDGRGYLLHNREGKRFEDLSDAAGVRDVDGARRALFVDLDHDGDLDLLLVGGGSLAVFRNNLDGTFSLFPNADGIRRGGSDAAFGDFDDDGRTDVFVASETGGDALFHNDGVRGFTATGAGIGFRSSAVAVGDYDNDGALDVLVVGPTGGILWRNDGSGKLTEAQRLPGGAAAAFLDYDNDGWLDLVITGPRGTVLFHNDGRGRLVDTSRLLPAAVQRDSIGPLLVADVDGDGDADIVLGDARGVHLLRNDGGNAHLAMKVQLTALGAGSGKNNSFGIGAKLEVRAGELYQTRVVTAPSTAFGLGTHFKADVLRVQWPNGVPQVIYFPGTDQDVLELQQLKGSCAFLYTWDGKHFRFITDVMWRSALGMPLGIMGGNAAYAPAAASQEYIRIPGEALQPRNGRYVLQVTEELWETAYLDQLRLLAVDHPDSVDVFVDERFPPASRASGLRLYQTVHARAPLSAVDGRGIDVIAELREHDDRYVSNLTPLQYQGLTEPHELILDLDPEAGRPGTLLVLRGWIFPSDASINVALSQQHKVRAEPPVLEVRDARGRWMSRGMVGFPSGKDKTMVIDLAGIFPTWDHHVRLRTNLEIYWDQAFVAETAAVKGQLRRSDGQEAMAAVKGQRRRSDGQEATAAVARVTTLVAQSGDLHFRGFSRLYRRGGRYGPHWFDYDSVTTQSPWRPITGAATRFGDVRPLLDRSDDQYVIMVPGDEVTVEFETPAAAPPRGWKRDFLLYSDGWIKDSDLNTAYGTTVEPLPYHAIRSYPYGRGDSYPADTARQRYRREYNTRIIKHPPRLLGVPEER